MLLYLAWRSQPLISRAAGVGGLHCIAGSARWLLLLPAWSLGRACNR